MQIEKIHQVTTCYHCGDTCYPSSTIELDEKYFCCSGCKTVYSLLNESELCNYYTYNHAPGKSQSIPSTTKFTILDNPEVCSEFVTFKDDTQTQALFYIPQIHCSSCLYLLEKLHKLKPEILYSQVDFANKKVNVTFLHNQISIKEVAEFLSYLGYEPYLSLDATTNSSSLSPQGVNRWIPIGVAGFAFGNIMLLSFPEYLGLDISQSESWLQIFRVLSFILTLPVIFYSAREFFSNSFKSLRQNYLNVDVPLALAISIIFARSTYEIVTSTGSGYLDSLTGIVFFMLVGRAVQDKTIIKLNYERNYKSYFPIALEILRNHKTQIVKLDDLVKDDIISIKNGEIIPVDGLLSKGKVQVDYSYVTGENYPSTVNSGDWLYAGGKVVGKQAEILVVKPYSQSNFIRLWNNPAFNIHDTEESKMVNSIAKYFTLVIGILSAIAFAYWYTTGHPELAWNAVATTLIVACPCALLLSATFSNGFMMNLLSHFGFHLKNALVLEKIRKINRIVFDKTGTLTNPVSSQVNYYGQLLPKEELAAVITILSQTTHPLAQSIVSQYKSLLFNKDIEHFKEVEGQGIEAWYMDKYYKLGSSEFLKEVHIPKSHSSIHVKIDNRYFGYFQISNEFKTGVKELFQSLSYFPQTILSGDGDYSEDQIMNDLGFDGELYFHQTPESKLKYIQAAQQSGNRVMMVGDGLNDAGALKQADVGIALIENNFSFTPACDAMLESQSVQHLPSLLKAVRSGELLIYLGFGYSIIYNVIGLSYALQGTLRPVIAAILMPASSIGIVLLTYLGSIWVRRRLSQNMYKNHSIS